MKKSDLTKLIAIGAAVTAAAATTAIVISKHKKHKTMLAEHTQKLLQKSRIPVYTLCYGAFSFQKSPGLCASGASSTLCAVPFLRYLSISSSSSSLKIYNP